MQTTIKCLRGVNSYDRRRDRRIIFIIIFFLFLIDLWSFKLYSAHVPFTKDAFFFFGSKSLALCAEPGKKSDVERRSNAFIACIISDGHYADCPLWLVNLLSTANTCMHKKSARLWKLSSASRFSKVFWIRCDANVSHPNFSLNTHNLNWSTSKKEQWVKDNE